MDHPRSRGVYEFPVPDESDFVGSSPLARGLRRCPVFWRFSGGIIPARAGFTCSRAPTCRSTPDHPRSRGVYVPYRRLRSAGRGSSPLARGLLSGAGVLTPVVGIIPARAGFTAMICFLHGRTPDHPRSRGVYPEPGRAGSRRVRIIPARAGFTTSPEMSSFPPSDHPRSRGVYPEDLVIIATPEGSSPLARGLPTVPYWGGNVLGIIPARAGFTSACHP